MARHRAHSPCQPSRSPCWPRASTGWRPSPAASTIEAVIHKQVFDEQPVLEIEKFSLWYGHKQALFDVSLPISKGRVTAIIGPSGCGKSTLLRCVNRMNDLIEGVRTEGDMRVNGDSIYAPGVDVIELRKRMGMVFQKPNPFPMSIFDNVVYPLRDRRRARPADHQRRLRAEPAAERPCGTKFTGRLHESALSLSGGQQQRLCIARAIAGEPDVLLARRALLGPRPHRHRQSRRPDPGATAAIFPSSIVTHNMQQASRVSDYTAFMYLGRLIEYGPTSEIFTRPKLKETESYVTGRFG